MKKYTLKYKNPTPADACELAHKYTVKECKKRKITVDEYSEENETKYTEKAQDIFNKYYDLICEINNL